MPAGARLGDVEVGGQDERSQRHPAEPDVAEEHRPPDGGKQEQGGGDGQSPRQGWRAGRHGRQQTQGAHQRQHQGQAVDVQHREDVHGPRGAEERHHQGDREGGQKVELGRRHGARDRQEGRGRARAEPGGEVGGIAPVGHLIGVVEGALGAEEPNDVQVERGQDRERQRELCEPRPDAAPRPVIPSPGHHSIMTHPARAGPAVIIGSTAGLRRRGWSRPPPARSPGPRRRSPSRSLP